MPEQPRFRHAHASAPDWVDAATACAARLGDDHGADSLGFLYLSDYYADDASSILQQLRTETGIRHWVGGSGIAVSATATEYHDRPALSVLAGDFAAGSFRVFASCDGNGPLPCGADNTHFAIVHGDGSNSQIAEMIEHCAGRTDSGFLIGGLTSSRGQNLQIADTVGSGGLSGAAFSASVSIASRLTQGCSPIGPQRSITECSRNVIVSIDERPALDVLVEDIGELPTGGIAHIGGHIFAGLPVPASDTGDYLVRNLMGVDVNQKLVAIGDIPEAGAPIMFCRRNRQTARADMTRMLNELKQSLDGPPRAGLYHSCLGRGPQLFGEDSAELSMIRDALGDFPLAGFFANGEISHNRLYGYTGVLTLFT